MNQKIIKVLFLIFSALILSIFMLESADTSFQNDSESLAVGSMVADLLNAKADDTIYGLGNINASNYPSQNVYSFMGKGDYGDLEYKAYKSQVGLQGMVYCIGIHFLPKMDLYFAFRGVCCLFLVIVIMLIVWQLYKKYGLFFSIVFGLITILSPWVINFSRNLYWVEFTWYIPMLLSLLCLNYEHKRVLIYPLFFVAIFIKSLCGYEYISTIMMAGITFLVVEFICNNRARKELSKCIVIIGILSILGFISAYIIHAFIYGSGNILDGLKMMQVDLVEKRTFGNAADFDPVLTDSLNASIFDVLVKYFWSSGRPLDGKIMMFLAFVTSLILAIRKFILKKQIKFEFSLFVVSLLATLSWLVLGKSHSYIHTHMNFVLFYFGWVQVCIYIILSSFFELMDWNLFEYMEK